MTKKTKLGFTQTSIRNLTDTELDAAAGGAITRTVKCRSMLDECPDLTELNSCEGSCAATCGATCGATCAASCAATCAATCAASCAASCAGSCNASCGGTCNIRCNSEVRCASERRPCPSWNC